MVFMRKNDVKSVSPVWKTMPGVMLLLSICSAGQIENTSEKPAILQDYLGKAVHPFIKIISVRTRGTNFAVIWYLGINAVE